MSDPNQHIQTVIAAGHVLSLGAIVGCFAGLLPPLAALAAIVWYAIQIWESDTVRAWFKRKEKRNASRPPDSI